VPGEDDRPRDASSAAGEPWADVVVPDDIRELADDVAAYRRELRRARRARWTRRLLNRRSSGPLLALTVASLLAGLVALMLTVMAPRTVGHAQVAAPLAHPSVADGRVGGLLPSVTLTGPSGPVSSRSASLRPAVFAIVPKGCGCTTLLDGLAGEAYSENLRLAVVVAAPSDASTAHIVDSLDRGAPSLYLDPTGALAASVTGSPAPTGSASATIVVVDRDGTIYDIEPNITDPAATSLDAALQSMVEVSK
jgi:hypothetical protein